MHSVDPLRRSFLLLLIAFLGLAAAVGTIGYGNYTDQRARIESEVRTQLLAVADMKVRQVVAWRNERLSDASVAAAAAILPAIRSVLAGKPGPRDLADATAWLTTVREGTKYANAVLIDAHGQVRLTAGEATAANSHYQELLAQLRQQGKVIFSDIHYDTGLPVPHMGLSIPLHLSGSAGLEGALLLGIDPSRFLYPLIQTWPAPSASAETLLVRREGGEVVFLNELRHRHNAPLSLRAPLSKDRLLAVMAVNGREGLADGVDYRGVAVLGVLRKIPDSPWWLVTKVDADEVYAPIHQQAVWLALLGASLLLTVAACGGLVWRHLRASLDRQHFDETKRAEETLQRSEERFRSVVENAPAGIVIHTGSAIRYANPAALSILGAGGAEDVVGRALTDFTHPHYKEWPAPTRPTEQEWLTADGRPLTVEVSAVGFGPEHESSVLVFFYDVSERKRAEEERRNSQKMVQSLIEATTDAVFVKDTKGRYLVANSAVARAVGKPISEILGRDDRALWPPGVADAIMAGDRAVLREHQMVTIEEQVRFLNGTTATYFSAKGPMTDEKGEVVGMFGISRDVTERHRAEQERARLQEQLQQAQKMESIGRLAGGVAHDFNNLLTVINGYVSMLLAEISEDDPIRSRLVEVDRAGTRAAELTRQLLAFSRKQVTELRVIDVNQVVEEVIRLLRRLLGEDIHVTTVLAPDLSRVQSDPGQMHQLLMNLAVNARDAMPKGGKFIIETENVEIDSEYVAVHGEGHVGSFVLLSVTDDGAGMDEATRQRAFEPFFTTKPLGEGTGLGLSMVYAIIKQSGGWISLYSEPGKGTTFRIYLPATRGAAETGRTVRVEDASVRGTETVLVVEDQDEVRRLTVEVLRRFGYHVLQAANGPEAIGVSDRYQRSIDVLLTDVVMPEMTGRELAARLAPSRSHMRVLYMSGYTGNLIAQKEVLEGSAAYISKPFSPHALGAKLREVLAAAVE